MTPEPVSSVVRLATSLPFAPVVLMVVGSTGYALVRIISYALEKRKLV